MRAHLFGYERLAARGDHFKVALDVLARVPLHIPAEHGPDKWGHNKIVKVLNVILEQDVGRAHKHRKAAGCLTCARDVAVALIEARRGHLVTNLLPEVLQGHVVFNR